MINGVIFQENSNTYYKGVEGNNWYLNDSYQDTLKSYFREKIDISWINEDCVDVCNDIDYINLYRDLSEKNKIDFNILLCETDRSYPVFDKECASKEFLGFDYAYSGGSYYSAVLNDIVSNRIEEFRTLKLNKYGLFGNIDSLKEFIKQREAFIKKSDTRFELGDFIIYKLYRVRFE